MGFSTKENEKEVICTHAMDGLQIQERKVPNSTIFSWFVIILVIPVYWKWNTPSCCSWAYTSPCVTTDVKSNLTYMYVYIYAQVNSVCPQGSMPTILKPGNMQRALALE